MTARNQCLSCWLYFRRKCTKPAEAYCKITRSR